MSVDDSLYPLSFSFVNQKPQVKGLIKQEYDDFIVEEELGFELSGEGEFLYCFVEKKGLTTQQLVKQFSEYTGIPQRLISFAGMKDKQACTRQWLCLHLGLNTSDDFANLRSEQFKVLKTQKHNRKLRRGGHRGNYFCIKLRDINGDFDELKERLSIIQESGIPNYYGPQRFGNKGDNVINAVEVMNSAATESRLKKGMLISSARSWLFNTLLSQRVDNKNWNKYIEGDVMSLEGSGAFFTPKLDEGDAADIEERVRLKDIHPSGPLWGKGEPRVSADALKYEQGLTVHTALCEGLQRQGLKQERRSLRLMVKDLQLLSTEGNNVVLEFRLPKGSFATSVLRELVDYSGDSTFI